MHYFIDGYNMLFRMIHSAENLKMQREALLRDLKAKNQLLGLSLTIIFDSHYQKDNSTRSTTNTLEIIYTSQGETADEYIFNMLKDISRPSEHMIVTSDKKLAWLCRRRLAKTQSVEEFLAWFNKRYKNKQKNSKALKKEADQKIAPLNKPSSAKPVEGTFSYYLEAFEKTDPLPSQPSVQNLSKKKPSLKEPKKLIKVDPLISDMVRWLHAFEKNQSNEFE